MWWLIRDLLDDAIDELGWAAGIAVVLFSSVAGTVLLVEMLLGSGLLRVGSIAVTAALFAWYVVGEVREWL